MPPPDRIRASDTERERVAGRLRDAAALLDDLPAPREQPGTPGRRERQRLPWFPGRMPKLRRPLAEIEAESPE